MTDILSTALSLLQQGETIVEATVIREEGSTPRSSGAKMIIGMDGKGYGTIGGGKLEAIAMEQAKSVFQTNISRIITINLTGNDAAGTEMICGGHVQILLELVTPDKENVETFRLRNMMLESGSHGYYLTVIEGTEESIESTAHFILQPGNPPTASIPVSAGLIEKILLQPFRPGSIQIEKEHGGIAVIESSEKPKTVYIFGAGHVALWIAMFGSRVGFRIVILDDRPEFADLKRFPDAHEILVLTDFSSPFSEIEVNPDDYIVIVTRGHVYDRHVLAGALKTGAAYIGMIGSRRKRDIIFSALREDGFSPEDLDRVHSPIGLQIHAETPEEIAISIIAELIRERAGIKNDPA